MRPLSTSDRARPVVSAGMKWPLPSTAALPCHTGSGWTRIPAPCSAGERGPWLLLPGLCPGWLRVSEAASGPGTAWMRGHPLLQPHNFPQKPSLEEAAGGLGGVKGSVAFHVFGKTFFSLFRLLGLPRAAGQSRGDASPQLPAQGTCCYFPF